ncbi:MAG: DUF1015 domain-containing protein [Sphaerochaetaceae bacterium]|nr:DUF1015 domain-containing protein [Sphaerochaetaceae bacterium]
MKNVIENLKQYGICPPDILIPSSKVDLTRWAVVACDQFTSELDYWKAVNEYVGDAPSTLHMIYPEVYLEEKDPQVRIRSINRAMASYLEQNIFDEYPQTFFLVHRQTSQNVSRWGLMAALDLEQYDWSKGSRTIVRATEGTIESRIPPRKQIRKDAPLELPHIMVLISDEKKKIIEPFIQRKDELKKVYDTELMQNGGHLTSYAIRGEADFTAIADGFRDLFDSADPENPLIYAMGDGNHSLATAKACWDDIKKDLPEDLRATHPARYALVEIENIFDPGLVFEPIHRVLFNTPKDLFFETLSKYCDEFSFESTEGLSDLMEKIADSRDGIRFGYNDKDGYYLITVENGASAIAAGVLQYVIDDLLSKDDENLSVDYIHGEEVTRELGAQNGNIGLFLPAVDKSTFFETIIKDGALPRKTFSMGEANEKRYYMEARRIKP